MKKRLFLLIPALALLSGCNVNQQKKNDNDEDFTDEKPVDLIVHAGKVKANPNYPFYLKVGETKTIKAEFDQTPEKDEEKTFTWSNKNKTLVDLVPNEKKTHMADITGLKEGTVQITATNDYNKNLVADFSVKVLDLNEKDSYLWQYDTADRAQFGYDSKEAKLGTLTGTALLAGKEWRYERSNLSSLQSSGGSLGFGKGDNPETHVHLETDNDRIVKKIVIEAASAHSLANMKVTIGENAPVIDRKVNYEKNGVFTDYPTVDNLNQEGKISIDFDTPEFDSSRIEDPTYVRPGGVFLKSILIYYETEEITSIEIDPSCELQTDYFKGDTYFLEELKLNEVTSRGVRYPIDVEAAIDEDRLSANIETFEVASHEAKDITLTYIVKETEQELKLTYQVHVRDEAWEPEKIEVIGSLQNATYEAGDSVSYSDLKIKVIYEAATDDFIYYPFEESDRFSFTYDDEEDPFVALESMKNGYTITVKGKFNIGDTDHTYTLTTTYVVAAGILDVTPSIFERINLKKTSLIEKLDISSTAKKVTYTPEGGYGTFIFEALKIDSKTKLAQTNKSFEYVLNNKEYVIDRVNLQLQKSSSKTNNYQLETTVFGGTIYSNPVATLENNKIVYETEQNKVNGLKFVPGKTSTGSDSNTNMLIISMIIRFKPGTQVEYTLDKGTSTPNKLVYNEGEKFDPTGLQINLVSDYNQTCVDVTDEFTWYDGSTYNKKPQEELLPESTYVVGVFHDTTIQIDIEKVVPQVLSLTLVKDVSEITDEGHYFIVDGTNKLINLGSASDFISGINAAEPGVAQLSDVTFGDTAELNIVYKNDYFNIIAGKTPNTYLLNGTNGHGWSVKKSGGATSTLSPQNGLREFTITIDPETGLALIRIAGTTGDGVEVDKFLNTSITSKSMKFDLMDYNQENLKKLTISIYKVN